MCRITIGKASVVVIRSMMNKKPSFEVGPKTKSPGHQEECQDWDMPFSIKQQLILAIDSNNGPTMLQILCGLPSRPTKAWMADIANIVHLFCALPS